MEKWYLVDLETFNTLNLPGIEVSPSNHNVIVSVNQDRIIFRPQDEYNGTYIQKFDTYQILIEWIYDTDTKEERNWVFTTVYYILILPIYFTILLFYGFIFGQSKFFLSFVKKTISRFKRKK